MDIEDIKRKWLANRLTKFKYHDKCVFIVNFLTDKCNSVMVLDVSDKKTYIAKVEDLEIL